MRWIWTSFGVVCVALGSVGVILPLLPTTPFLLLAAYAFGRSSPRMHAWMMNHRVFGPGLRQWSEEGAVGRRAKVTAVSTMVAMFVAGLVLGVSATVVTIQAVVFVGCSLYILTRPSPSCASTS
ncbi:MAG: YbaN family protein [Nannocystaceae bacterium]|nr:YbaN family protein [Nannocystaceae bacterium]